jgi:MinD superfamily P-loop ATPase
MTKSIAIISGKGGTGKTSVTASLAVLAKNPIVVDCDVDAADLHLILKPDSSTETVFVSGEFASIDLEKCTKCGKCIEACAFDAISETLRVVSDDFVIDEIMCEGCGVCKFVCPANAIKMTPAKCGFWYVSKTRTGVLVHARLDPGKENSGRLVSLVRTKAMEIAKNDDTEIIIIDGSPGVGCAVIASITGNDIVVIITEPSLSGLHDLERAIALTKHFKITPAVIINRHDLNQEISERIAKMCKSQGVEIIGNIPYTTEFTDAQLAMKSIVEYSDGPAAKELRNIWRRIADMLGN